MGNARRDAATPGRLCLESRVCPEKRRFAQEVLVGDRAHRDSHHARGTLLANGSRDDCLQALLVGIGPHVSGDIDSARRFFANIDGFESGIFCDGRDDGIAFFLVLPVTKSALNGERRKDIRETTPNDGAYEEGHRQSGASLLTSRFVAHAVKWPSPRFCVDDTALGIED
jgi:hypothetical protein